MRERDYPDRGSDTTAREPHQKGPLDTSDRQQTSQTPHMPTNQRAGIDIGFLSGGGIVSGNRKVVRREAGHRMGQNIPLPLRF